MDGFIIALGVVTMLVGVFGFFYPATGRSTQRNAVMRILFCVGGREQSRAFTALSSGALIALGAYWLLSGVRPGLPLWPSLNALVTVFALQIAAHLQHHDV